jgi:predicted phage tail protein
MEGLTTIHLGGKLGQLFGKKWTLKVSSPAEAIRAIDVNLRGKLRAYLSKEGAKKFYRLGVGKKDALIEKSELHNRSGNANIYLMPVAKGRNSGGAKILLGIAIIASIALTGGFAAGGWAMASAGGGLGIVGTALVGISASLVLGGITQMLTPTPNFNNNAEGDSRGSNLFGGNASAISQGGAVGLVYGRALVTPMPVSISFDNKDQSIQVGAGVIRYERKALPGGGYQYIPIPFDLNPDQQGVHE